MSSDEIAISARGLGKSYRIVHRQQHSTMAEALLHRLKNPFQRVASEEMWALNDISFDVARGDIVGIVGHNGAGKSTLFKILSRIVEPTRGEARIVGRVGSLIEVGTGFQPELTGRENIFLNGAILGMRRREIARRFDEIVDFSGVERFLDTPVKNYSSGMYVRLAFAVAAHLDTDILMVDEVLSVGDAEFQKKSLGKMGDVANSGRTVLFVSHSVSTLEALCKRGILLDAGRVIKEGPIRDVVTGYHQILQADGGDYASGVGPVNYGQEYSYFRRADLVGRNGKSVRVIPIGGELNIRTLVEARDAIDYPTFVAYVNNLRGENILTVRSPRSEGAIPRLEGLAEIECRIGSLPLAPGEYSLDLAIFKVEDCREEISTGIRFTVRDADAIGDGYGWGAQRSGICVASSKWELRSGVLEPA
jgi:lipopolysaccharide transport system ATP-binding protein